MNTGELSFRSLDACLGPGDQRFFGSGYKRVGQQLFDLHTDGSAMPGATITARAGLRYPQDWSRKAAGRLQPHLSTIDAIVLAVQLAEVQINHARALDDEQQRHTWLCHAEVRAGMQPQEDLDRFPCRARLRASMPGQGPGAPRLRSTYDCLIGNLKVRCTLEHAPGRAGTRPHPTWYATGEDALGPASTRHYGEGYKARRHITEDVKVDLAAQRVRAAQRITVQPQGTAVTRGAEAAYEPSASVVDIVVGIAQLAQVMLYNQDDVSRGSSNTLWMRRMHVEADAPLRPLDRPFEATAYTKKSRLLPLDGSLWRCTDLAVDDYLGIRGSCSIAHRLPEAVAA
ncbi:AvrD family protein [Streptomyces sp. HSW2009]|uniref:AvrD family protein n=1 Tax=Streptomyces sp. HSW2009 TaxID=3142890 RepID=UPI0032ED0522